MEKITFQAVGEEPVDFYVLEQTTVAGVNYILVTEDEDGDCDALILKDLSSAEDAEADYVIVEDEKELNAVAGIVENLLDDGSFEQE